MKTVDEIITDVLKQEGGFVDDPADAGGATNRGISLRYARGIGLDLDSDGDTDRDDILLVTMAVARKCYERDFYYGPRINVLPTELQPQLVDIAVNSGPPRSIMMLQEVLDRRGFDVEVDGVVGKKTRVLAEQAVAQDGWEKINNALVERRRAFYSNLVERRPDQRRFLAGWLRRASSFHV